MADVPRQHPRPTARLRPVGDGELRLHHRVVHGYRRAYRMVARARHSS